MSHPNLSKDLNDAITRMEASLQVKLAVLSVGTLLVVETSNTTYKLKKVEDGADGSEFEIEGNRRFCPRPVRAIIPGCTFGGSVLKVGTLFEGGHMEFVPQAGPYDGLVITTSTIRRIDVVPPKGEKHGEEEKQEA